jgi:putative transposase
MAGSSAFWPWSMTTVASAWADTSLSGLRVTRERDELMRRRSKPTTIVSDNGIELTSMVVLEWCQETDIEWHYISRQIPSR